MHWIPSHIENTAAGLRYTGNYYADRLANIGRQNSEKADEDQHIHKIREQLLYATICFIDKIDNKLKLLEESPDGPPVKAGDLSLTHAERDHSRVIP